MKTYNVDGNTIARAIHIIETYELGKHYVNLLPPPTNGSRWMLSWYTKKNGIPVIVYVKLFPRIIKILLEKYGKRVEDILFSAALASREKRLVQVLWKSIDKDKQKALMAGILGAR